MTKLKNTGTCLLTVLDSLSTKMINKWIEFTVEAASVDAFKASLAAVETGSKAEEGCVHYAAFQSEDDATLFTVLECWASKEAFEAHRIAPHIAKFKEDCGSVIVNKKAISLNPIQ